MKFWIFLTKKIKCFRDFIFIFQTLSNFGRINAFLFKVFFFAFFFQKEKKKLVSLSEEEDS